MKTKLPLAALALALATLNSQLSTAHAQGALTPPGAPAPTMKSLDQIEARTPISSAPFTISQPGSYYLTGNLTVSSGDAITIAANGVTLDLNGFNITSTRPVATTDSAILLSGARTNISIYNGNITSGVTNSAAGVFSGSGFAQGIAWSGAFPRAVRVQAVSVSGVLNFGIDLGSNTAGSLVKDCSVITTGSYGIRAGVVFDSTALNSGSHAIYADNINNSTGSSISPLVGSSGIFAFGVATGCTGYANAGAGVNGFMAVGCRGTSVSGTAISVSHNVNSF